MRDIARFVGKRGHLITYFLVRKPGPTAFLALTAEVPIGGARVASARGPDEANHCEEYQEGLELLVQEWSGKRPQVGEWRL